MHVGTQTGTGRLDQRLQRRQVQRHTLAAIDHEQVRRAGRHHGHLLASPLLGTPLAIQHIGARHFVVAPAHQAEFDVILHVFDVEGAATRARTQQGANHRLRQALDGLAHAGRRRTLGAVHGQEGLHQRHRDLVRLERDHGAVAADDLVADIGGRHRRRAGGKVTDRRVGLGSGRQCALHRFPLWTGCVPVGALSTRPGTVIGSRQTGPAPGGARTGRRDGVAAAPRKQQDPAMRGLCRCVQVVRTTASCGSVPFAEVTRLSRSDTISGGSTPHKTLRVVPRPGLP